MAGLRVFGNWKRSDDGEAQFHLTVQAADGPLNFLVGKKLSAVIKPPMGPLPSGEGTGLSTRRTGVQIPSAPLDKKFEEDKDRYRKVLALAVNGLVDRITKEREMAERSSVKDPKKIKMADVVRTGDAIIVPESLSLDEAMAVLKQKRDYEQQVTRVHATIPCFLYEGAWAFHRACSMHFGWVQNVPTPGFFGDTPPAMLSVPISRTQKVPVPWGRITLPVVEGWLETGASLQNDRFVFTIVGEVKRKYEAVVNRLIEETQRLVREDSIYRGKAFRIRFKNDRGQVLPVPEPQFLNLDQAPTIDELIFQEPVFRQLERNIFTMITRTDDVERAGVPLKRGVLLTGRFGTGKTLVAAATALLAEQNDWTYILCERADEFADVVRLAQMYGRTVVFCEDIDRVMAGERTITIDEILNVVDGVDAKSATILTVLTTNDIERINQAMLRPGRIDEVIEMLPPDAVAVGRLIRLYGRGLVPDDEKLDRIGRELAGQIPAVIRDTAEGAKLAAIPRSLPGSDLVITEEALLDAAYSKKRQIELLQEKDEDERSDQERAAEILAQSLQGLSHVFQANRNGEEVSR